ncbi:hypothetical protein [Homoserinimonas sp. A520]
MAGVSEQNISAERLLAATGRLRDQWHELLDEQNASTWTHTQIATWLRETHGVDGWWAQGVTVGYEQAKGMRVPGQQPDGTFSTSASKTVERPQSDALELAIDAYGAAAGSEPVSVSRDAKHPTARWKLADGTTALATVSPGGGGKSRIVLTHSKLAHAERLGEAKAELAAVLDALASRVDRSVD